MISAETLIAEQQQFFEELRYNKDRFRDFLHTMVHHYRQPVDRQVQIFFHAPRSGSAYASAELWQRLGTQVSEGAVGVPVLGADGTSVTYLYDISETQDSMRQELRSLVWHYDAQQDRDAIRGLFQLDPNDTMEQCILTACQKKAADESAASPELTALGAAYIVLARLGMDAEAVVGLPLILAKYEDVRASELLDDISRTATAVLGPVAKTVREREREASHTRAAGTRSPAGASRRICHVGRNDTHSHTSPSSPLPGKTGRGQNGASPSHHIYNRCHCCRQCESHLYHLTLLFVGHLHSYHTKETYPKILS